MAHDRPATAGGQSVQSKSNLSWQIKLERLATSGIIGVYPWERKQTQTLYISLTMEANLNAAAGADDVALTVDYGAVAQEVQALVASCEAKLIEHLAKRIADQLLASYALTSVEVQVDKPDAVAGAGNVAVVYRASA